MIAVRRRKQSKRLPSVSRTEQASVEDINRIDGFGIGKDVGEIPRALAIALIVVYTNPVVAGIIRTVDAALFRFDQRVHAAGISSGDADPNPSHDSVGQAVALEPLPCVTAVARFVQSAAWSAAVEAVWCAYHLPQRSKENVCVVRIKHNINCAGVIVFVENLLPSLAAITGTKNAALRIGAIGMTQCCYERNVGIARIDNDRGDVLCISQADVLPGLSAVKRFEHSIAIRHIPADASFTGSGVDHIVVGVRDRNRTD